MVTAKQITFEPRVRFFHVVLLYLRVIPVWSLLRIETRRLCGYHRKVIDLLLGAGNARHPCNSVNLRAIQSVADAREGLKPPRKEARMRRVIIIVSRATCMRNNSCTNPSGESPIACSSMTCSFAFAAHSRTRFSLPPSPPPFPL